MASVTAIMAGIDKGLPDEDFKSPPDGRRWASWCPRIPRLDWNSFLSHIKKAQQPVKIGYHSPTSAPKIVLEGALKQSGIKVTEDPNDQSAQVLLADLKETTNIIPRSGEQTVRAIVGPSPFPEVAVSGRGKLS